MRDAAWERGAALLRGSFSEQECLACRLTRRVRHAPIALGTAVAEQKNGQERGAASLAVCDKMCGLKKACGRNLAAV
jgi:hypothetical protein